MATDWTMNNDDKTFTIRFTTKYHDLFERVKRACDEADKDAAYLEQQTPENKAKFDSIKNAILEMVTICGDHQQCSKCPLHTRNGKCLGDYVDCDAMPYNWDVEDLEDM